LPNPNILALAAGALFHRRYRVVRTINAGGMGVVYEVVDTRTSSPRALKVILANLVSDPDVRARFALEATITGGIQSEHLVQITDAGVDAATATPFLVMDLLHGSDLGRLVEERGTLSPAEVVCFLYQAGLALDKTHAAGIVHRDLKPENLFVVLGDDGAPCVKVLDFGIAKVVADNHRATQTRSMGTPLYMSPEQISGVGEIGPPADVYAVGQIAYALLTGEPFWSPEADAATVILVLLSRIMVGTEEAASDRALRRRRVALPPAFDAWFRRVAAVSSADRFDRVGVAVAALADALAVPLPRPSMSSIRAAHALTGVGLGEALGTASRTRRRLALRLTTATLALSAVTALALALRARHAVPAAERPAERVSVTPPGDVPSAAASAVIVAPATAMAVMNAATATPSVKPTTPAPGQTAPPIKRAAPPDEGIY
jgi:Protein kinase domain